MNSLLFCESFFEASVLGNAEHNCTFLFFNSNPADVSTTHFKFVFKCIINSIFPSSSMLHLFVEFFKDYCTECHLDFTTLVSEACEFQLLKKIFGVRNRQCK